MSRKGMKEKRTLHVERRACHFKSKRKRAKKLFTKHEKDNDNRKRDRETEGERTRGKNVRAYRHCKRTSNTA